jgi:ferrochelatase
VIIEYTETFSSDPLYFEAQAERIKEIWGSWAAVDRAATQVIFTAHSIPATMCEESCLANDCQCYGYQFHEASRHISLAAGIKNWRVAYQSRSGNLRDLWLEPDVREVIGALDTNKIRNVLLVPVGFLCDNAEILYDLDHAAKAAAEDRGLKYYRAGTVGDHPLFIEMMADRVLEKLSASVVT